MMLDELSIFLPPAIQTLPEAGSRSLGKLAGPVELGHRRAGDDDVPSPRGVVDPQCVGAFPDFVEHGRECRAPVDLALEHILVAALPIMTRGADLDLDAMHRGIGVDDQGADVPTD